MAFETLSARNSIGALVGGAAGGLVWAFLNGFESVALLEAAAIAACALLAAEQCSIFPQKVWARGLAWGLAGGLVIGIGGLLLFPIENAAKHIVVTTFATVMVGLVNFALRDRQTRNAVRS